MTNVGDASATIQPAPLPNFLGIGAPRAGTTWLHNLLDVHPDVLMPSRRKELGFFTLNYDRGLAWYAESYTVPRDGIPSKVGEISPYYMYEPEVRPRVDALGTVDRFIVSLRDPVDLLWSGYKQVSGIQDFRGSLVEFVAAFPEVVHNGFYARALAPWFDRFGRDRFHLVRFDDLVHRPVETRAAIASFLGVDPDRFPQDAGLRRVNQAVAPRFRRLYSLAKRSVTRLHRADRSWVVSVAKRVGVKRLVTFGSRGDPPGPSAELRRVIAELYVDDLLELERLTRLDVGGWLPARDRQEESVAPSPRSLVGHAPVRAPV